MKKSEITNPQLREMLDLPPLPVKRKPGRPSALMPATLEDALKLLLPHHQQFVRHVLADKNYSEAYKLISTQPLTERTAQVNGSKLAQRKLIAQAIKLGREQGALQAVSGIQFDTAAAFNELGEVLEAAMADGQYNAAARASELRAKLFKLIDSNQPVQAQQVTFVFKRHGDPEPIITIEKEEV